MTWSMIILIAVEKECEKHARRGKIMKDEETCKKEIEDYAKIFDNRCDCCCRHIDELKPFGGPGDPLAGDFTGLPLVKVYRYDFPKSEIPSEYSDCLKKDGEIDEQRFIEKYGREMFDEITEFMSSFDIVSSYRLCRDCILLDREQFCKKSHESFMEFMNTKGIIAKWLILQKEILSK